MNKLLKDWCVKSILVGLIIGFLSLLLIPSLYFGIPVFIIVSLLLILNNPKRRFMRVFWIVFSAFITLNKFSLWVAGSVFNFDFYFNSTVIPWIVSITLLLLSALLLVLDYFERNKKPINLLGFININSQIVDGNNISFESGTNVTQIIVHGDFIEKNGITKNFSEFDEVKQLIKREEELQILISSSDNSERKEEYRTELNEIQTKTKKTKEEITDISKTINLLNSKYPKVATQATQFLLSGSYGRAKDYFMQVQEERQDRKLAEKIGVSYDELLQLDHRIEDGHTSSDGMLYYYNIWFSEDSPTEIIDKITGVEEIGNEYCLEVSPWFFDEPEDYYDPIKYIPKETLEVAVSNLHWNFEEGNLEGTDETHDIPISIASLEDLVEYLEEEIVKALNGEMPLEWLKSQSDFDYRYEVQEFLLENYSDQIDKLGWNSKDL